MTHFLPWLAPYSGWALMLTLFLLGAWLTLRALRSPIIPGQRRCPKCKYDLSHSPTPTCSECGYTLRNEREARRRPRRWLLAPLGLLLALGLPTFVIQYRLRTEGWDYYTRLHPFYYFSPDLVFSEIHSGPYTIRISTDRRQLHNGARYDDQRLTIQRGRSVLWSWNDRFVGADEGELTIADLDNDGIPELICSSSSGGTGGYGIQHIFSLGPELLNLNPHAPDADRDGLDELVDLRHDGHFAFTGRDYSFENFHTSGIDSVRPQVFLRLVAHHLIAAPDLMRTMEPPLDHSNLSLLKEKCLACAKPQNELNYYSILQDTLLQLIYTGHTDPAYKFLDEAWIYSDDEKKAFLNELNTRINASPYQATLYQLGYHPYPAKPPPPAEK